MAASGEAHRSPAQGPLRSAPGAMRARENDRASEVVCVVEHEPSRAALRRVGVLGSGNWGSTIARIIGYNVRRAPMFVEQVKV
jgi:hypothetical protein